MQLRLQLSAIVCAIVCAPASALASPLGVVISQFQVRGPSGGNDEFVEIRNTSSNPVDISGWKLQGCTAGTAASPGSPSTRVTVGSGVVLSAGQYFLFTNSTASTGYSGAVPGDATYGTGITDFLNTNGAGIQLLDATNVRQDGVGSPFSLCREGTGFTTTTSSSSTAYFRNQDTDNNLADFAARAMDPHNRASPTTGGGDGGGSTACTQDGIRIFAIQGRGHLSPVKDQVVCNVPGIVTMLAANGFFMQDGDGDGDPATSDGVFVFTGAAPSVAVGQQVKVKGTVTEFRPGSTFGATGCPSDSDACGLTTTEIAGPATITPASNLFANNTIQPVILGNGGRIPPREYIDRGLGGASVEVAPSSAYDATQDGIDFYESLESMVVQVNNARAVGPSNSFGEIWLVGDMGANASGVNSRGGLTVIDHGSYVDNNPERILVDVTTVGGNGLAVNVGDTTPVVTGIMSYGFGNFRILPTALPTFTSANLARTVSTVGAGADRLRIASYNVENLDTNDNDTCDGKPDRDVADGRFKREAQQIVAALGSPDILGIEELQDNSGCVSDGVVDSGATLDLLISEIVAAGGPQYSYTLINPLNNDDGGVVGGNIRQGILYNPARVTFVPGTAGAGDATTATQLSLDANGKPQLTLSPGRIDPTNTAWRNSRKPLVATFDFNTHRVLVIVNHLYAKGGDGPLFGRYQPTPTPSDNRRIPQAQVLHDFVAQALALAPSAKVVTLGDFNDFDFTPSMATLTGRASGNEILTDLGTALLPPEERYSYVFEGNSQELDHIYVTPALMPDAQFQPVHVNAEYSDQVSDHDPMIASLLLPVPDTTPPSTSALAAPGANADGWNAGPVSVTLSANDNTGGSGVASISWSMAGAQSGSGTFASPIAITAEGSTTVTYFATDRAGNAEAPKTLTVRIDTIAPSSTAIAAPAANAAGWNATNVAITLAASDAGSGVAGIAYTLSGAQAGSGTLASPGTVAITAEGATTITWFATDKAGNAEAPHALAVNIDKTAPVLTVPAAILVDATSTLGAAVIYGVTATDNSGLAPRLACSPASGATYAIGTTSVACTATDAAGNAATARFTVTVRSLDEQVARFVAVLQSLDNHAMPPGLANAVRNTYAVYVKNGNNNSFCSALENVATSAANNAASGDLAADVAASIAAGTQRMRTFVGCAS